MTKIEYPGDADTPRSHLPFSPATKVGNLLFVSGQASVDATGKVINDTFEGELRRSMDNLRKVLQSAGSDLEHVAVTRNYIGDPADGAAFNKIYLEYFKAPYPARTTISKCLGGLKYEIDCIAVVKSDKA